MSEIAKKFGKRLKKYRLEAKLTQAELAEAANTFQGNISQMEQGKRFATYTQLVSMCMLLQRFGVEVTPNDLLGWKVTGKENKIEKT